ncbi:hypothetical protein MRX96_008758 [Rhipicephalus microplus]
MRRKERRLVRTCHAATLTTRAVQQGVKLNSANGALEVSTGHNAPRKSVGRVRTSVLLAGLKWKTMRLGGKWKTCERDGLPTRHTEVVYTRCTPIEIVLSLTTNVGSVPRALRVCRLPLTAR